MGPFAHPAGGLRRFPVDIRPHEVEDPESISPLQAEQAGDPSRVRHDEARGEGLVERWHAERGADGGPEIGVDEAPQGDPQ